MYLPRAASSTVELLDYPVRYEDRTCRGGELSFRTCATCSTVTLQTAPLLLSLPSLQSELYSRLPAPLATPKMRSVLALFVAVLTILSSVALASRESSSISPPLFVGHQRQLTQETL